MFAVHDISDYLVFGNTFLNILNKHVPFKNKTTRANHAAHVRKVLSKVTTKKVTTGKVKDKLTNS